MNTTGGLLDDLDSYPRFKEQCQALLGRVKAEEDARFDGWLSEMQDLIDDDDASLRLSGALMGWKEGVLVVNFSDSLVQFLREVRQLDEMGFDIPRSSGRKSRKGDRGRPRGAHHGQGLRGGEVLPVWYPAEEDGELLQQHFGPDDRRTGAVIARLSHGLRQHRQQAFPDEG